MCWLVSNVCTSTGKLIYKWEDGSRKYEPHFVSQLLSMYYFNPLENQCLPSVPSADILRCGFMHVLYINASLRAGDIISLSDATEQPADTSGENSRSLPPAPPPDYGFKVNLKALKERTCPCHRVSSHAAGTYPINNHGGWRERGLPPSSCWRHLLVSVTGELSLMKL